jgi:aspartokinase
MSNGKGKQMSDRLQKLKEQQEQLNAKIKRIEQKEKEQQRKVDTRKKILIGAMVLDKMSKSEKVNAKVISELSVYLTSERDKKLFDIDSSTPLAEVLNE